MLGGLPVGSIPAWGERARNVAQSRDLHSRRFGLCSASVDNRLLGRWGEQLIEIASGNDCRPVVTERPDCQKSYSKERTLERDTTDYTFIRSLAREHG